MNSAAVKSPTSAAALKIDGTSASDATEAAATDALKRLGNAATAKTPGRKAARVCASTLAKIVDNILDEHRSGSGNFDAKKRSLKLTNKVFKERVGNVEGGVDFLLACGFRYSPNAKAPKSVKLCKEDECVVKLETCRRCLGDFAEAELGLKGLRLGGGAAAKVDESKSDLKKADTKRLGEKAATGDGGNSKDNGTEIQLDGGVGSSGDEKAGKVGAGPSGGVSNVLAGEAVASLSVKAGDGLAQKNFGGLSPEAGGGADKAKDTVGSTSANAEDRAANTLKATQSGPSPLALHVETSADRAKEEGQSGKKDDDVGTVWTEWTEPSPSVSTLPQRAAAPSSKIPRLHVVSEPLTGKGMGDRLTLQKIIEKEEEKASAGTGSAEGGVEQKPSLLKRLKVDKDVDVDALIGECLGESRLEDQGITEPASSPTESAPPPAEPASPPTEPNKRGVSFDLLGNTDGISSSETSLDDIAIDGKGDRAATVAQGNCADVVNNNGGRSSKAKLSSFIKRSGSSSQDGSRAEGSAEGENWDDRSNTDELTRSRAACKVSSLLEQELLPPTFEKESSVTSEATPVEEPLSMGGGTNNARSRKQSPDFVQTKARSNNIGEKNEKEPNAEEDAEHFLEKALASISFPDDISDSDAVLVRLGLKMCFSSLAVACAESCSKISQHNNVKPMKVKDKKDGGDYPVCVPVEVALLLWSTILGLTGEVSSMQAGGDGSADAGAGASASAVSDESTVSLPQTRAILRMCGPTLSEVGNREQVVCEVLKDNLVELKLLGVHKQAGILCLCVEDEGLLRYGVQLASTASFGQGVASEQESSWQGCLADSLLQHATFSGLGNTEGPKNSNNDPFTWYAAHRLIHHLLGAGRPGEAERLLTDAGFLRYCLNLCGPQNGTLQVVRGCSTLTKLQQGQPEGDSIERAALVDRRRKAASTAYKFVALYLRQGTAGADSSTHDGRARLETTGCALHDLAAAFGALGEAKDELVCYSEALAAKKSSLRNGEAEGESIADTLHCMGSFHQGRGELFDAMTCYDRALRIYKAPGRETGESISASKTLHNLGVIYCERNELDVAMGCFEQSLRIRESVLGKQNESVSDCLCWIGRVHREKGSYDKALECFLQAHCTKEALLGKDHVDVAESLQNVGIIYDDMGKYDLSLQFYKKCLHVRRMKLGDEHEDVVETLNCIANVYRASGENEMALNYFKIALQLREESQHFIRFSLMRDSEEFNALIQNYEDVLELAKMRLEGNAGDKDLHGYIAVLLHHMGSLYDRVEEYEKAIEFYVKSLQIRKINKDHKGLGTILNVLGIAHAKRRHYRKAMKCFEDALKMRKATLGHEHLDVAETLHNMGNCSAKQGSWDKAMRSYREALKIKQLILGQDSVSAMKTLHNMGTLHEQRREYEEALKCLQSALLVRKSALGEDSLDVAFSLHSIGKVHKRKRDYGAAMECFSSSLRIKKAKLGSDHLSVAETLHQMASIYDEEGKKDDAQNCLATALSTYERKLGDSLCTADVLESYGAMYESNGDYALSMEYYQRAHDMKKGILGSEHIAVSDVLYRVGKIQERQGDIDGVLTSFKEVMRIRKKVHGKDSLGVAAVLNDVGVIQLRRDQHEIAERCFMEAMRVWNDMLGHTHEYVAETLVNLAELDHIKGKYNSAVERFAEAMSIFKEKRGVNHLSVALTYHKMGISHAALEEFGKASEAYEKCLSIRAQQLGADSIPIAEVLGDLGIVYFKTGDYEKARESLGDCLRVKRDHSCANDLGGADVMYYLGMVMVKMKYHEEAAIYFEDSLAIRKEKLGNDHLDIADVLAEMGGICEFRRKYMESLDKYSECLRIRKMHLGDHDLVADIYHSIGAVQQILHEHDLALKSFGSALSLYKTLHGADHIGVAKAMNNIGLVYDAKNDYHLAMKYHKEAYRLRRLNLGDDHPKVASSLDNIAGLHQKQKSNEKALKCLKESLRIRTLKLGKDHLEVGTTLFGMGIIFCDMGNLDKAMECYNASLSIRRRKLGRSSVEVAQTLHNMGSVYALKCDYGKALQHWKSSLDKYREAGLSDDHHMVACTLGNIQMAENLLEESDT